MTSAQGWGIARRLGFRFGFLVAALEVFPFPLGMIPMTDWISTQLSKPLIWANHWLGQAVFSLPPPYLGPNGSGDTSYDYVLQLITVVLAALGTILWSVVDRRRTSYPRLVAGLRVVLRYWVAWAMLSYGVSKVMKSQFYDISPTWLHQRIGDTSPMRTLWSFMGYSLPYTVFAGLLEMIGGILLLWRRTATLGAMLVAVVMANVVVLNFCYDVPVKLDATRLLAAAVVIALPGARRVIAAALGYATPEVPPRVRLSRRRELARLVAKIVIFASLGYIVYKQLARPSRNDHGHELYGIWTVDTFVADGVELPPLTTDPVRWAAWTASARNAAIWHMNGDREARDTEYWGYPIEVDAAHHAITVTIDDEHHVKETWTYTLPAHDHVAIDGVHAGKTLHVTLHLEPESRLLSRGFHWINEAPFNP
jgi:uncharacterized membrane protein YphA (DoxX/SURF4 family)